MPSWIRHTSQSSGTCALFASGNACGSAGVTAGFLFLVAPITYRTGNAAPLLLQLLVVVLDRVLIASVLPVAIDVDAADAAGLLDAEDPLRRLVDVGKFVSDQVWHQLVGHPVHVD